MGGTVRWVVGSGVLIGSRGRSQLREPHPEIDIPPTAEALIAARIDGLHPPAKALIQTAAAVGSEMTVELLQRVSGLRDAAFAPYLASARDSGLLFEVQVFPRPRCGFRHTGT